MTEEAERMARAIDNLSDRVTDLQGAVAADAEKTAQVVRLAMREGIRDVLNDRDSLKNFWETAYSTLQESATKHTGRLVLGSLKAVFVKGSLFLLLGTLVYSFGGWSALVKLWQTIWSHS